MPLEMRCVSYDMVFQTDLESSVKVEHLRKYQEVCLWDGFSPGSNYYFILF